MTTVANRTKLKLLKDELQLTQITSEDRRRSAAVLEVLTGLRTPQQAADELHISLPTYYNLEMRAMRGFTHACCHHPPGRDPSLEPKLRQAQREAADLKQQLGRYQALLRSAQRGMGLSPAPPPKPLTRGKRKQKAPAVRAIRTLKAIQQAQGAGQLSVSAASADPVPGTVSP